MEVGTMTQLIEQFEVTEADFEILPHDPQWIPAGAARVCAVCGEVSLGGALRSGVVWGRAPGQPQLDDDAEEFYRQEQWS